MARANIEALKSGVAVRCERRWLPRNGWPTDIAAQPLKLLASIRTGDTGCQPTALTPADPFKLKGVEPVTNFPGICEESRLAL